MYLSPDRVASNDRFGSCADLRHHLALRPVCGDKPTFSPERRLNAGKRTLGSDPPNFAFVPRADIAGSPITAFRLPYSSGTPALSTLL